MSTNIENNNTASIFIERAVRFLSTFIGITLAKKIVCCLFLEAGIKESECGKLVGLCEKSVRDYKKALAAGLICRLLFTGGGGRKSKLGEHENAIIEEIESGEYHTQQEIADMALAKTGIKISTSAVKTLLDKHGIKKHKNGSLPSNADPAFQRPCYENELSPLMKEAKKGEIYLEFIDTSHFVFGGSYLGSIYGKQRRYVKTSAESKRISVIGSLEYGSNELTYEMTDGSVNQQSIVSLLIMLSNKRTDKEMHVILDNASYNTAKFVKKAAETLGITLHYLPTYSPNLNLIERIWRFIKSMLRRKYYDDCKEFIEALLGIIASIGSECKNEIDTLISEKIQLFDDLVPVSKNSYIKLKPTVVA